MSTYLKIRNINKMLIIATFQNKTFTWSRIFFGYNELIKYIYSNIIVSEYEWDSVDLSEENLEAYLDESDYYYIGETMVYLTSVNNFDLAQINNYFEYEEF